MFLEYETELIVLAKVIRGFIVKLATDTTIDHRNYFMGEKRISRLNELFKKTGSIDKSVDTLVISFLDDNTFIDNRERILSGDYDEDEYEDEKSFLDNFANSVIEYFGLYEILSLNEDDSDYFRDIIIKFFQGKLNDSIINEERDEEDEDNTDKDINHVEDEPNFCDFCDRAISDTKITGSNSNIYCSDYCAEHDFDEDDDDI